MLNKHVSIIMLLILIMGIAVVLSVDHKGSLAALADNNAQSIAVVPINITNTQNIATPGPFQVMINVNNSEYAAYEAADLSNIAFTYPNGTVIPSWLESGNSNSSTDTVYWVKIGSIPATSTVIISMNFYNVTANMLNNVTIGEAPTLSPSYGEYDNGPNVFVTYGDFMNSFDGWQANQYAGNFVPQASANGVEMLNGGHSEATYLVSPSALPPSPTMLEEDWSYSGNGPLGSSEANVISMFGMPLGGSSPALMPSEAAGAPVLGQSISAIFDYWSTSPYTHINDYIRNSTIGGSSFTGGGNFNVTSFLAVNGTWAWSGYANDLEQFNWTHPTTSIGGSSSNPFQNSALIVSASDSDHGYYGGFTSTQYIRWIIGRTMPPNDIEPSVTMGNLHAVPEFPSIIILPVFIVASLLAVVVYRRKHTTRWPSRIF